MLDNHWTSWAKAALIELRSWLCDAHSIKLTLLCECFLHNFKVCFVSQVYENTKAIIFYFVILRGSIPQKIFF